MAKNALIKNTTQDRFWSGKRWVSDYSDAMKCTVSAARKEMKARELVGTIWIDCGMQEERAIDN